MMMRHVFLLLFLLALALPALTPSAQAEASTPAANCHDAMPAGTPHQRPDSDGGKASGHVCIGCVAHPAAGALAVPTRFGSISPHIAAITALAGADILPSTPPPRT